MSRIRSTRYIDKRGTIRESAIIKQHMGKTGYRMFYPQINGRKKALYVHRVIAEMFIPNPMNLPQVNHKDGVKDNCSIENLEWVTNQENIRHAIAKGLMSLSHLGGNGDKCPASKLKAIDVATIKIRLNNGESVKRIANEYHVSQGTIGHIKSGKTWRNI
jgi:ribosomal protein S9